MDRPRITEMPNELTQQIDVANPLGIVNQLRQSDAQLFAGWGDGPSVNDFTILERLGRLSQAASKLLKENHQEKGQKNIFVFSGCGTSGRVAWLCSQAYNRLLVQFGHPPCFHYLISGGDESLLISKELPEDDPPQGVEDLKKVSKGSQHTMLFGITCGLSAPYVAGQIDYAMNQCNTTTVLLGFNPVALARNAPIEKWHKTCRDVFKELEAMSQNSEKVIIINPIVGPEPITGSTRMKGGSMTKILLDTIFLTALQTTLNIPLIEGSINTLSGTASPNGPRDEKSGFQEMKFQHLLPLPLTPLTRMLDCFSTTYCSVYRHAEGVASLLRMAAVCLSQPAGRLVYLGANSLGAFSIVDASEMVPTYGAGPEEVRGFVEGGWQTLQNTEGDISGHGNLFKVGLSDFESELVPSLTPHDCVVCIQGHRTQPELQRVMARVLSGPAQCGLLVMAEQSQSDGDFHHLLDPRYVTTVFIRVPYYTVFGVGSVFAEFGLKLVLNAVSTGANILKGRVYGNSMINLTLSNDKLFYRSLDIVRELSGANQQTALAALLKAIYRNDNIAQFQDQLVSSHIKVATSQNMVVPLALLLASGQSRSVADTEQVLSGATSLKSLIGAASATA